MLTKRVIPCLDVAKGRVVRGVKFSADKDAGDPVALAAQYNAEGADELVFYDITASHEGRGIMLDVLERTAREVFIPLCVGGGLASVDDMWQVLRAGADKTSLNSRAVANPELINQGAQRFGSQCIVLSIDAKRMVEPDGRRWWQVYLNGGRVPTGKDAVAWAVEGVARGAGELVLNSIDADGTREGYDLELLREVNSRVEVPVVASGGAGKLAHFVEAFSRGQAHAVLAASVFHYGVYTIRQVKDYLAQHGLPVRL
ncbi:MAG TPA: imidazole glycerol phosphate synthase subunit HisF [Chloroflexota bacterium]|nr:imidazole glycerol phosphate synthase subunit HisF [Chloroflexota bacterium]